MQILAFQTGEIVPQPARKRPPEETWDVFKRRFSNCRGLLHSIACRVLGNSEDAELAIQNCWFTASSTLASFDSEGAVRSWLLRVLIDEALTIRRRRPKTSPPQKGENQAPVRREDHKAPYKTVVWKDSTNASV
jgi:DNA-directed RNA polymerase specialized sigma24 family protein